MPPKKKASAVAADAPPVTQEAPAAPVAAAAAAPAAAPHSPHNGPVDAAAKPPAAPATTELAVDTAEVAAAYDAFTELASANAEALPKDGAATYAKIVAGAQSADIPPHIRVRCLQLIAEHGGLFEASIRDTFVAVVKKILGAAQAPEQPVLLAGLQAVVGLCKTVCRVNAKKGEFCVREGADVLTQVALDADGNFDETLRLAAKNALMTLVGLNFEQVVLKLLHWISDEREDDDAAQLATERAFALDKLQDVCSNAVYAQCWTDDVQTRVLKYLALVVNTATHDELARLTAVFAALPVVKAAGGAPLLDIAAKTFKSGNTRSLDVVALLSPYIAGATTHVAIGDKLFPEIANVVAATDDAAVLLAKSLVVAARCASAEAADKTLPALVEAVLRVVGSGADVPASLTQTEALLLALGALGHKAADAAAVLQLLHVESFTTPLAALAATLADLQAKVVFVVKKKSLDRSATSTDAQLLATVGSLVALATALSTKHLPPVASVGSWEVKAALPRPAKRTREGDDNGGNRSGNNRSGKQDQQQKQNNRGDKNNGNANGNGNGGFFSARFGGGNDNGNGGNNNRNKHNRRR